ncbi:MAG: YncE family protein, partial [Bacteroidales bacterium]|nr:YncE family protein [Bacteroidales bacterium]
MSTKKHTAYISLLAVALLAAACRKETVVFEPEVEQVAPPDSSTKNILGFYLLNEGNMGSNKSTLDYY